MWNWWGAWYYDDRGREVASGESYTYYQPTRVVVRGEGGVGDTLVNSHVAWLE